MTSNCEAPRSLSNLSDIVNSNPCNACNYSHKYKSCDCLVKCVDKKYLTLCGGNNTCNHEVYLMGDSYTLKEVRLYAPGLHQYGADPLWQKSAAEIVLVHSKDGGGTSENLCVCIPVKQDNMNPNGWFSFLQSVGTKSCSDLQQIKTGSGWNLEDIMPPQFTSPYYYYDAITFPWGKQISDDTYECGAGGGTVHYVVYDVPNSASISGDYLKILTTLINNSITPISSKNSQRGSSVMGYNPQSKGEGGGQYFLDCKSTIVDSDTPGTSKKQVEEDTADTTTFWIVISLVLVFLFISVFMLWKRQGRKQATVAAVRAVRATLAAAGGAFPAAVVGGGGP